MGALMNGTNGLVPLGAHPLRPFVLVLAFSLGGISTSRAQAPTRTLTWEAPPECPQREDVLAAVREITGDELFARTTLHANGRIRRVNGFYRLELESKAENGTQLRVIDANACSDLLGASAVVLGLTLKRLANEGSAQPSSDGTVKDSVGGAADVNATTPVEGSAGAQASESSSSAKSEATPQSPKPPSAAQPPVSNPRDGDDDTPVDRQAKPNMWLGLPQVHLEMGSLPAASLQWSASVGFRTSNWLIGLSGRYQPTQIVQSESVLGAGATVRRMAAEIGLARAFRREHFEWAPTVLLGMDYLIVGGRGEDVLASEATTVYPFVAAGVTLRWLATSWLSLAANLAAEVPLARPRLIVDVLGEVGQMGSANGRLSVGSEWNF